MFKCLENIMNARSGSEWECYIGLRLSIPHRAVSEKSVGVFQHRDSEVVGEQMSTRTRPNLGLTGSPTRP